MCLVNLGGEEGYLNNMVNDKFWRLADKFGIKISTKLIKSKDEVQMDSKKIKDLNDADPNANFEVRYRYEGPSPERDFCKKMIAKDKFYSKSEIDIMSFSGINRKYGHKRRNYSIFKWKSGPYCKHHWQEYSVTYNGKRVIQAVDMGPVPGLPGESANASNNYNTHPNGPFRK